MSSLTRMSGKTTRALIKWGVVFASALTGSITTTLVTIYINKKENTMTDQDRAHELDKMRIKYSSRPIVYCSCNKKQDET